MKKPKKKRRPNPLKAKISRHKVAHRRSKRRAKMFDPTKLHDPLLPPSKSPVFSDPIILHHIAGVLLRYMELAHPVEMEIMRTLDPGKIDAEFQDKEGKL